MRLMFDVGKMTTRRSALWLLFPSTLLATLLFANLFISRSANSRISPVPSPSNVVTGAVIRTEPNLSADVDHDGLPDVIELRTFNDRENFRRWFTWIAEMQFYKLSDEWNAEQRDCSGLARFAWREALRTHDRAWYQRMGEDYQPVAPDVSVKLGSEPLGEKIFRTAPGNYNSSDVAGGKFSEFADAQTLKPYIQKFPYHVMIFLGDAYVADEGARDWVVYHTGAAPENRGTVKKVRLEVLDQHPNRRWRPLSGNPNFLGFYRLKLLHQSVSLEE